jgi:threonylcarbamoyladenosine tRNA methylthiotransferase MtaB
VTLRLCIRTVGCRTNQADSLALALDGEARGARVVRRMEEADVVIINSCAVTSRAARDVRRLVGQARRRAPRARLIVTGCMVEVEEPGLWTSLGVSRVVPVREKMRALDGITGGPGTRGDPTTFRPALKVQEGCSIGCRYCIVPRTRGPERSVDEQRVVRAAARLAGRGAREVVLTGTQLGAWGRDLEPPARLAELVEHLVAARVVDRVRLSSIEPWSLEPALCSLLVSLRPHLCGHLHVPLQSGSARIHEAMGRPGGPGIWLEAMRHVASLVPDACLGTDVLVGFPGETPGDFADTEALLRGVPLAYLHVFPFSPRPGTPAADMPGRPPEPEVKRRVATLRTLSTAMRASFLGRLVDRELSVVVERVRRAGPGVLGTSAEYARVVVEDGGEQHVGRTVSARVARVERERVVARLEGVIE